MHSDLNFGVCIETLEFKNPPCFNCKNNAFPNYLKSGFFNKILEIDLQLNNSSITDLFDKQFLTHIDIKTYSSELFIEIKKSFCIIKDVALDNINFSASDSYPISVEKLRSDILEVLQYFLRNIQSLNASLIVFDSSIESDYLRNELMLFVKEIKRLLLFVKRISQITFISTIVDFNDIGNKNAINFYHYFHLCLDIWFNCIAIIYSLYSIIPLNTNEIFCTDVNYSNPFLQITAIVIYDLIYVVADQYKANNLTKDIYICSCISNFWLMLIHLLDKNVAFLEGISFWNVYLTCLQNIINSSSSYPDQSIDAFSIIEFQPKNVQNVLEACFCITSHITPLYKYSATGHLSELIKVKNGYIVLKYLMNVLFSRQTNSEKTLRNILSYCMQIIKIWEPSCDILLPLTDFYIKKIDETFKVKESEIEGLSYLHKDMSSWYARIQTIKSSILHEKSNSFDIFLCILSWNLQVDKDDCIWRSLKGRLYSKLIPRKVKELSEIGLQNSFTIFLVIAASNQQEIIDKICEIAAIIETTLYIKKKIISWKAVFVLLCILKDEKHCISKVITLISNFFNSACSDYALINNDSVHKTHLMNLLLVYIDNMNELLKRTNSLDFPVYQLIENGFLHLFSACSISDINYILGVFHDIFQKIDNILEVHKNFDTNDIFFAKTLQSIFNIYPFLQNMAITTTPPPLIANIAGILTKLSYKFLTFVTSVPVEYHTIFLYFVLKENVNSSVTCQYLCFVSDSSNLMDDLKLKIPDFDTKIFQSWLKCTINIQTKCKYMQKITKLVLQQNKIIEIVPNVKDLNFESEDHITIAIRFFKLIDDVFKKALDNETKIKISRTMQHYFKSYISYALDKLEKGKDGFSFAHIYKLTSNLVLNCSALLHYHVTSDYVLLQILDKLVYPQLLFPRDKDLQSILCLSIKEYLTNFIKGLFKLDYRKDKSIEREIKDIFVCYLGVYRTSNNPLTKLVLDSAVRKPEGLNSDSYLFILETLQINLVSNNIEKPMSILEFYQDVFVSVPPSCKREITNTFLKCVMELYMKQHDTKTEQLKMFMKKILIHFKEKIPLNQAKVILIPILNWFIKEKLTWAVTRGFYVLDFFVEYLPYIMSEMIPFLSKSIETLEMNRGMGEDMLLRNGLRNIVVKIQQKIKEKV